MPMFRVTYLDNETGENVRTWEGEAEDRSEAFNEAWENDYYFGKHISTEEIE